MLDTVLNLGLNDESVEGLAEQTGNERFAWDSYRRFVQMFGNVVPRRPGREDRGRDQARSRSERGVELDTELDVDALRELVDALQGALPRRDRRGLPAGPAGAARAGDPRRVRLVDRRARGQLPAHQPHPRRVGHGGQRPADGVRQQGRRRAARGVAFSRDEVTGAPEPSGDFLVNAQGEDVVSGVRNTRDIAELSDVMPEAHERADGDPAHARAPLQGHAGHASSPSRRGASTCSRRATPSAPRRPRCASRSTRSRRGCSPARRRSLTIDAETLDALLHPTFDPDAEFEVLARGVAASPGAAKGEIVFTRRRGGGGGRGGARRHPRAPVHRGRRRRRLPRGEGHPHERGRQGQPRGARRARHGRAGGDRRRGARDRPRRRRGPRGRRRRCTPAT